MTDVPLKQCTKCKKLLPLTKFSHDKNRKDGFYLYCKDCCKQSREANKEQINEQRKQFREANRDSLRAQYKQFRTIHRDRKNEQNRRSYTIHKDRASRYDKKYREKNREILLQSKREYYKTDRGKVVARAQTHRRRAQKRDIPGTLTSQQIQQKLKSQHYACYYCSARFEKRNGRYIYHLDHIIPLTRTEACPRHDMSYTVLACPHCNISKNNRLLHEWPEGGRLF